jgi:HSP20 family protein
MNKIVKYRGGLPAVSREEFGHLFDVDRLFDEMFGDTFSNQFGIGFFDKQSYPRVDIVDDGNVVVLEAEIPGLTKDDVSVEVEESVLTIKGSKKSQESDTKNKVYIRREIKKSSFVRSFVLGDDYEIDKISADFDHGLLKINIPKKKEVVDKNKKRKIL